MTHPRRARLLLLALVAAAVIPIALAAPLMVRVGQEMQARVGPAESSAASARLASELDGVRERLLSSNGAALVEAALSGTGPAGKAASVLDRIAATDPNAITGVWLLDSSADQVATSRIPGFSGAQPPLPLADARDAVVGAIGAPDGIGTWQNVVSRPTSTDLYVSAPVEGGTAKKPKKNLASGRSTGAPVSIGYMPT